MLTVTNSPKEERKEEPPATLCDSRHPQVPTTQHAGTGCLRPSPTSRRRHHAHVKRKAGARAPRPILRPCRPIDPRAAPRQRRRVAAVEARRASAMSRSQRSRSAYYFFVRDRLPVLQHRGLPVTRVVDGLPHLTQEWAVRGRAVLQGRGLGVNDVSPRRGG